MTAKMKTLSLALLGLTGFAFAGSALAACPTDPAQPNGPWASKSISGGTLQITSPGLDGTSCKLSLSLGASPLSNAKAFVTDTSPANEQRYRARFYLDMSQVTPSTFNLSNQQVRIFNGLSANSPAGLATSEVIIALVGGTTPSVRFVVADSSQAGINVSIFSQNLPTPTGVNRIEFDLTQGAPGSFRYWVSDGATATSDTSPTGTGTPTNTGWSGMKQVNLGLFGGSTNYRATTGAQVISVDEFDSRRQTFIGQ